MFTSESVTEGHPDKLCDLIADAVVDHYLELDPFARVVSECVASTGVLFIAARFASEAKIEIPEIARSIIHQVGYDHAEFNAKDCTVLTSLRELPPEVVPAVDEADLTEEALERIPARNQVTVFGFACRQSSALMPLPITLAHRLARRLTAVRLERRLSFLSPDGKTQVGIEYRDRRPHRIHSITLIAAQQLAQTPSPAELREALIEEVVKPVFANEELRPDEATHILVNPDGPFITGGPAVHSGLTGRKNAIDTYGEYARQSGAALSGKDPSRIDRIGAYAARYAAKNVVAAGLAEECEVQLSYTIGQARPVSVQVETFGTGNVEDDEIARRLERCFDFRPAAIIRDLNLRHLPALVKGGFYRKLAAYGHMGRLDVGVPWERVDRAEALK